MKFLLFGILLCVCFASLHGKEHKRTDVKYNGLKEHGKQVCSYQTKVYKMANTSHISETFRTKYHKSCLIGKILCKVRSRLVVVKVTKFRMTPQLFDRKNLCCCEGWMRKSSKADECTKPICKVECRNEGECVAPDKCKCKKGYEGKFCQAVHDDCKDKPCEQVCIAMVPGHRCACRHGWRLKEDKINCEDINECLEKDPPCSCVVDDGVCKPACINTPGSYKCNCQKGYRITSARQCEDINECEEDPHICAQICVNKPGTYLCKCWDGYEPDKKTGKCVDIDECKDHNGGCSNTCINIVGTYLCACPRGSYLGNDRKTCHPVKPTMKTKVICQSELVGELNCDTYEEKIMIADAMYGRLTKDYCQFGNYTQELRCSSRQSPIRRLKSSCDYQASCVIFLEKAIFGDPCPLTEKYMQVTYDCLK